MKKLTPIEKAEYIKKEYKKYLLSTFNFSDKVYQAKFEKALQEEELYRGPYLDMTLPFKKGANLSELIEEGVINSKFRELSNIELNRKLYKHQETAIRKANEKRNLVITTGTGSGKTECFLFPILNAILNESEETRKEKGIRAILLYPMNALLNDQNDRIRNILASYPDITFGIFNGHTPTKVKRDTYDDLNNQETLVYENELLSREEIRDNPPDILFTNYSMLEHLLIRPKDNVLFKKDKLKNWKYVVIDEAHTYAGALGIEISFLLKRLVALADEKPNFILTSATLGKELESENEIVDFAVKLTNSDYIKEDIIYAKRIKLTEDKKYLIEPKDYPMIESLLKSNDIAGIINKYLDYSKDTNYYEVLYELLLQDEHVHMLYNNLLKGCKEYKILKNQEFQDFTDEEFIALIKLINIAEKNGNRLFDIKYHSFIRVIDGPYITLGNKKELSLKKTNFINGYKAFEIANCSYCNLIYIKGRINFDCIDNVYKLMQDSETEKYDNEQYNELRYFVFEDGKSKDYTKSLPVYAICSKCGAIYKKKNLNANKCKCSEEHKFEVYGVDNKVTECVGCGHKNNKGVLYSLNLSRHQATALIAQLLYEAMGAKEEISKGKKISLFKKSKSEVEISDYVPQFLTFSDSRQQASSFAVNLEKEYIKFLRRRLIWSIIEDNNYVDIEINRLITLLEEKIKKYDLFSNNFSDTQNAWLALLYDLLKVNGKFSAEELGLYHFELNLQNILEQLEETEIQEFVNEYNLSKENFEPLLQIIFMKFRDKAAIRYADSTLTDEIRKEELVYKSYDSYITLQKKEKSKEKQLHSLLTVKNNAENDIVKYITKVTDCSVDRTNELIALIYNSIGIEALFENFGGGKYQIDASKFVLKNYKSTKYYKCNKCGRITPYNIKNMCYYSNCDGSLVEIDSDEYFSKNYYRDKYKFLPLVDLHVEEHTAQLQKEHAKEYQNDFKNKKINVLSCSTTFEMGVDLGDLETVFLRNVPPTPANYVQRAGRAGRRKDSNAFVLTFCGMNSHDYTYFNHPEKMIAGIIKPPYFDLVNEKIIVRHLMATSLGFFFKYHEEYAYTVDKFIFKGGYKYFIDYMRRQPYDLLGHLDEKIIPNKLLGSLGKFKWYNEKIIIDFAESILSEYKEYEAAIKESINNEQFNTANYFDKLKNAMGQKSIIEALSKNCVIPKYGFPVDSVNLYVYENGKRNTKLDLNRDLSIAISEYAPDSEIIVDKVKYTSRFISLPKNHDLQRTYYKVCENCNKAVIKNSFFKEEECPFCGESYIDNKNDFFIIPEYGFKTGVNRTNETKALRRTYTGETFYIGNGKVENDIDISNVIEIIVTIEDELMILNKSDFYMCDVCGYSKRSVDIMPHCKEKHFDSNGHQCTNDELHKIRIGHLFKTDVSIISLKADKFKNKEEDEILSFLYGFIDGICSTFNIERKDINGLIEKDYKSGCWNLIIYDNVPGGAGHVKRLINPQNILEALKETQLKLSQECCDEETSCYKCLRNYRNQNYHHRLKRRYALELTNEIIGLLNID